MVLRVYYSNKAESDVKLIKSTNAIGRTALYCGISDKTVYRLVSDFANNREVVLREDKRGLHTRYLHRHSPKLWMNTIENLANNANKRGETVSVRKLQNQLSEIMKEEYVHITRQTLTRLLHLMGFNFDKVNKARNFEETEMTRLWRTNFLMKRLQINHERPDSSAVSGRVVLQLCWRQGLVPAWRSCSKGKAWAPLGHRQLWRQRRVDWRATAFRGKIKI